MNELTGKTKQRNAHRDSEMTKHNFNGKLCDYGCGKQATHYFSTADTYCCEPNFRKCEHQREIFRLASIMRNAGSKRQVALARLKNGELTCCYCGKTAKYLVSGNRGCCSKLTKLCPNYAKVIGDNIRQSYIDDPTRHETMTKAMLKAQNRPEVIEKKRESMTILHNEDCDKCVEFQKHYNKGRDKFRQSFKKEE